MISPCSEGLTLSSNNPEISAIRSHPELFCKKVFVKITKNLWENPCAEASFLIKLEAPERASGIGVFMRIFVISRNIDIVEHWCVAASEIQKKMLKNMFEGARILIV